MGRRMVRKREKEVAVISAALAEADDGHAVRAERGYRPSAPARKGKGPLKPKNEAQAELMAAIEAATVVFAIGPAGTGKTHVAVSKAVEFLASGQVDRIILTRPAVEAEGEKLGFLPGGLQDKMDPFLRPLYDVLFERLGGMTVKAMLANGQIEIAPLAFMRGRTFSNAVIVLDEGQNATRGQLKMALTRIGEGSKMIITGDPAQSDLDSADSGLQPVSDALSGAPGIESVTFSVGHVVRSRIVSEVLARI